jgi:integrase
MESLRRPKNADVRSREYLRPDEVERLIKAAKSIGRHKNRDTLLILMMFRHGLRVNEAVDLKWTDIDWATAHVHVKRLKQGSPSVQPIDGKEMRLLRKVERSHGEERLPWIFISERRAPLTDHTVRKIVTRAGELAGFEFPIHPHMLGTAAVTISPLEAMTPALFRIIWVTNKFSTRSSTPSWLLIGLRLFAGIDSGNQSGISKAQFQIIPV